MNENVENNDWMNEAPTLAAMERRNSFTVPKGYFENCSEDIFSSVFIDGLKQKTKAYSFEVPSHYFEELTERIQANLALVKIPKTENAFAVPLNYFDTLQNRINTKITESLPKKEAKIISLWRRSIMKYASAACFLLLSSVGLYMYKNNESTQIPAVQASDFSNEQMLYDIDESTIIEHIENQSTAVSNIPTTFASDTEMENYILNNFSSSDLSQELNN